MHKSVKSTIKTATNLAILVTTILCNTSSLASDRINKIVIEGNKRIERSTIENYLKLKVGDVYNPTKEDESIKSLYATSLFETINIRFSNDGNLIVNVTETPFISMVEFKGNSKLKSAVLSKELLTLAGESLSLAKIQLDTEKIKEIYKRSGRFATNIRSKVETLENNRVKVIFEIAEGPKTGVKQIYFTGNNNYRNGELRSIILTKESRWFSFLETNDTYDPDRIEYDKELLKEFYQSIGFADFRVISATAELNPTKEYFTVTYSLEEGDKYNFGNVTIDNKLLNINSAEFAKFINVKKGETFNMKALEKIAEKITDYFASKGYPAVNVYPDISNKNADHTIDIILVVDKADKVFINNINITNNLKTEDKVIRREFRIAEGDIFNRSYLEKGERNLRNLDYFEKVIISVTPTDKRDRYNVNVNVEEKSTSSIGFDVGYNTSGGVFGRLSFLERNLVGTGKLLNAGVQVGKKSSSYYAGITEPYFLDRNLSLSGNIFKNNSGRGSSFLSQGEQNYTLKSVGFKTSLGYDIVEDLSHEIEHTIKKDVLNTPGTPGSRYLTEQMGKFVTSSISQVITYDQTDSKIIPKNGFIISGMQEFAGVGGNNKYLKHTIEGKVFKSFVNNKLTLKLAGDAGDVRGISGKTVRISDRFNLGDYSLRGFSNGGVGPREKSTKEGLGGEKYYTISTELSFPTGLPQEFNLTGLVFMDMGSLWGVKLNSKSAYTHKDLYNDKSLRSSVGFGFVWVTRLAPIRIDWAFPIKKKKYDDTQRFHLKFSTHF